MSIRTSIYTVIVLLMIAHTGNAQPAPSIIFSDSFAQDTVGHFPSAWRFNLCNYTYELDNNYAAYWQVQKDDEHIYITAKNTSIKITPRMNLTSYLPDRFNLDFDVYVTGELACAELIFATDTQQAECDQIGYLHITPHKTWFVQPRSTKVAQSRDYSGSYNELSWHHCRLRYSNRLVQFSIDGDSLFADSCRIAPRVFSLASLHGARFAHMAATELHPQFEDLITNSKLVTHAIHFDVNKAVIKPESIAFVAGLAKWLKEHPAIKLEIDGHTDNDGDATANMKLSQERADAVKNQLVAYGINALRLTAKGFGATVPIQSNTTPEGKADNRRVEFVKR